MWEVDGACPTIQLEIKSAWIRELLLRDPDLVIGEGLEAVAVIR